MSTQEEDYEGLRPLDLAKDNQHNECVQLLFKTVSPSLLVREVLGVVCVGEGVTVVMLGFGNIHKWNFPWGVMAVN